MPDEPVSPDAGIGIPHASTLGETDHSGTRHGTVTKQDSSAEFDLLPIGLKR